jgi:hypothetical protein
MLIYLFSINISLLFHLIFLYLTCSRVDTFCISIRSYNYVQFAHSGSLLFIFPQHKTDYHNTAEIIVEQGVKHI